MTGHALLAPSSAPQWGNCSGSLRAQADRPSHDSQETREGTAAHWVGSEVLLNRQSAARGMPGRGPLECAEFLGKTAPNGVVIDAKMVEGPEIYVADVSAVCERFGVWHLLRVEKRVYMPRIHPENHGTPDAWVLLPDGSVLFLWDYKHGHRQNPAEGHLQLVNYAEGVCQETGIDGMADQRIRLVVRIVQPFCYSAGGAIDEWSVPLSDLRPYWNRLAAKAWEALNRPTLTSGPWCRDCRAVGDCVAAKQTGYNLITVIDVPYAMDKMDLPALAVEREQLETALTVAKARFEAIEDELQHRIAAGEVGSGLAIEVGYGRLGWTVPPAQAVAVAAQFGVDASTPGVITPTETIKAAPVEVREMLRQTLKNFTRRPPGKAKLVPLEGTRSARAFAPKNPS